MYMFELEDKIERKGGDFNGQKRIGCVSTNFTQKEGKLDQIRV